MAKEQGLSLTGPDGLLKQFKMVQQMMRSAKPGKGMGPKMGKLPAGDLPVERLG